MFPFDSRGPTDVAAQVAVVQGVDSNVYQTGRPPVRHPALFTSLEGSLGAVTAGRNDGDSHEVRVFGRLTNYEPLGARFESRTGRAGLSQLTSTRLDRYTTFSTLLLGSVGSLQAARGTDGVPGAVDPVSTRRSAWYGSGSFTIAVDTSARTTIRMMAGADASGTLSETLPDTGASVRRGLDFLVGRTRWSLLHRLDRRTQLEGALLFERLHTAYVLRAGSPSSGSLGAIDGASASATLGVTRLLGLRTFAFGLGGITFAVPRFGERGTVLPIGSVGVNHIERTYTVTAFASFQYGLLQPRLGPGGTAAAGLVLIGRPLEGGARDRLDVIADLTAQRTGISVGANEGGVVTAAGGSFAARIAIGSGLGMLVGYDVRAVQYVPPATTPDPWFVRHLGFVGLSYAWASRSNVSSLPTLVRPTVAAFTP